MSEAKSAIGEVFGQLRLLLGGLDSQADVASRSGDDLEPQPNSQPLGAVTGVPPATRVYGVQVSNRVGGVMLVGPDRAGRSVRITTPDIAFGVFIGVGAGGGGESPNPGGFPIAPAIPYEIILSGYQTIWAITNSPVFVQVLVQVAPLLIGDRERAWAL